MSVDYVVKQFKDSMGDRVPAVSCEFFPPRDDKGIAVLKEQILRLMEVPLSYVSVTYGAGGSTKGLTYDLVKHLKENTTFSPAAHLTCVNASKAEINDIAQSYLDIGVNRIVALRGDVPGFSGDYVPREDGYAYADDLVKGLKELGDFDISVAAYPETHPQAQSPELDIEHLKRKFDAGADRAITQYCFDTDDMLRFLDKVRKAGIDGQIVPGVVTMNSYESLVSFSNKCSATIPGWLDKIFKGSDNNPYVRDLMAVAVVAEQCRLLMQEGGVDAFHFYSLNRVDLVMAVCGLLGVKS